jgi:ribosomal protein L2
MNTLFLKKPNSRSPGMRHARSVKWEYAGVSRKMNVLKHNRYAHRQQAGRNHSGAITVFGRGGGSKTLLRKSLPLVDFVSLPKLEKTSSKCG